MTGYTLDEALADAREWTDREVTCYEGQRGWRPAMRLILNELSRLRDERDSAISKAAEEARAHVEERRELRVLLRDIRADAQCAHWHEDIDALDDTLTIADKPAPVCPERETALDDTVVESPQCERRLGA